MKIKHLGKKLVLLLSLILIITAAVQPTVSYVIVDTRPVLNTFSPLDNYNMLIEKEVEHSLGSDYEIPEELTFDFDVYLEGYAGADITVDGGVKTADENSVITVSVKPGVPLMIYGIDEGTKVIVTEKQNKAGFTLKEGISAEQVTTVTADGVAKVSYVNKYTPDAANGGTVKINGVKLLDGRSWKTGDSFTFVLERKTDSGWTQVGTKIVAYSAQDDSFNFFDFSGDMAEELFDKLGNYSFRIREVKGSIRNMKYDDTVSEFTLSVTDKDMDGKFEVSNVKSVQSADVVKSTDGSSWEVKVSFTNIYEGSGAGSPDTGDTTNLTPWVTLLVLSTLMLSVVLVLKKRRKN